MIEYTKSFTIDEYHKRRSLRLQQREAEHQTVRDLGKAFIGRGPYGGSGLVEAFRKMKEDRALIKNNLYQGERLKPMYT